MEKDIMYGLMTFVMGLVFLYLYIYDRRKYLAIWAFGWLIWAFESVLIFLNLNSTFFMILRHIGWPLSGLFLFWGINEFLNKKIPKGWVVIFTIISVYIFYKVGATSKGHEFFHPKFIVFAYLFVIYIWSGIIFLRWAKTERLIKNIVGSVFILAGCNMGHFFVVEHTKRIASVGYVLAAIFTLMIAIGILLIYYQSIRTELSKSEEKFRFLAENAQDLIYRYQLIPVPRYEYVSPSSTELTGYTPEEYYANPGLYRKLFHPQDWHKFEERLQIRELSGEPIVLRWVKKDGQIAWFEQRNTHIYENGKLVAIEGIARDITAHIEVEEQLRYLSLHDSLTGLYNRAYFEQEMTRLEKNRHDSVGIIMCDIDDLKCVNDQRGHQCGDKIIIAAAHAIQAAFRKGDMVARIGGDEFAVLLPDINEEFFKVAVDRIQRMVEEHNQKNPELSLQISVGYALRKGKSISMTELFKEADNMMYEEKIKRRKERLL